MKRIGNLYSKVFALENIHLADKKARRGKKNRKEIIQFDLNRNYNLLEIHRALKNKTFTTSPYIKFTINDGKPREVFKLPHIDRIVHHALINILEPIFNNHFSADTYSCIKFRGIHKLSMNLRKQLKKEDSIFCLKIDIRKFYPSISTEILKQQLRRKFKDKDLLWLLDNIIDSEKGLPIGNLCSQSLANFYLTGFDKYIKQELRVKSYGRYCDDCYILGADKNELRVILNKIRIYLADKLDLQLKDNFQIFPISVRGIDIVGYKHFHDHVLLRKSIKKRMVKMLFKDRKLTSIASYHGWLKWGNCVNLQRKYGLI